MIPAEVAGALDAYMSSLERAGTGQVEAVYVVGSIALGDFSARQSNVDLVVVSEPGLDARQLEDLRRAEHALARAGRPAVVWHTTWEEISSRDGAGASPLATPLTRALLRSDALPLVGPDWPVVGHDPDVLQAWCAARLRALVEGSKGLLVLRRAVTPMVLEACRLAEGAITGRVLSKSAAGEAAGSLVPSHFRRILTDAVGYRGGAQTSMYWGPFERKYDALVLLRHLVEAVPAL